MDDRVRVTAVAAARQLLSRYRDEHPAWQDDTTPIDDLVSWLGISIETFHPNDYPQGTYGFLEPGEDLIWLCRNLVESLRRFTLAHELGHAMLHRDAEHLPAFSQTQELSRDDPCQQPDIQEEVPAFNPSDLLEEDLGIGMTYDPRSERELAANIFAAELLMPLQRVRTLYLDQHVSPHLLTGTFAVSNAAMLNRLAGLLTDSRTIPLEQPKADSAVPGGESRPREVRRYDEFQRAAIEAATPALIVAGPGSGKTSTLIGRVEYLITAQHVQPTHILALTFSRKAAQEMEERLQTALQESMAEASSATTNSQEGVRPLVVAELASAMPPPQRQAPAPPDLPKVSTFHAFCADVLRTHGTLVGLRPDFTLIDETEGYFLLRQLTQHMQLYHYRNLKAPAYYFPDFLKAISRAKDELVAPAQYLQLAQRMLAQARDEEAELSAKKALEVASMYALYEEGLQRRGDTDFGGLIMLTVRLLEAFPEVRAEQQQRFQHILVDEFQDINRASGVLLRLLAGDERRVWVVGDANQAIYGFRGASPANIANFQQDYPGAAVLPLSRNYRSRPDIVAAAETFRWRQLELGEEVQAVSNQAARSTSLSAYVTLASAENAAAEETGIITDIRQKRAQGYSYADIAILCRTRTRVKRITRALAEAGLPAIEQSGILTQQHIKDLLSILLLMTDASGMGILRAARQKEHFLSQDDIEALLLAIRAQKQPLSIFLLHSEAPPSLSVAGRHALSRLTAILQALFQSSPNVWSLLAQYLFIETSLMRDLLCEQDSRQRVPLDDYAALLQLARRYDQQQQAQRFLEERQAEEQDVSPTSTPNIQEQVRGFLDYLNVMLSLGQEGGNRQQGGEGENEEQAAVLQVMTVHASKGLEFPVVYLPGLIQRNFPLQKHTNPMPIPASMLPAGSGEQDVHEVGEACLFYVGVTRARDQLILSYSQHNGKQRARPSPYLEALVADLPAERLTRLQWSAVGDAEADGEEVDEESILSSQPSQSFLEAAKPGRLRASDIETYQICPRKYLYSTIYGFSSQGSSYQVFWQATQKTLELLQNKLTEARAQGEQSISKLPTLAEAHELYTQQWQELGGHTLPFAAIYERHGHEVTELIRNKLLANSDTNWELRPSLTVEVGGRTISVPIDRVEVSTQSEKPAKFVRTRFARRNEKPTAGLRELLYARAYRQHHSVQSIELHFHNLSTGETFPITLNAKKEQSLYDELEQSIAAMERNEYPPHIDARTCPTCAFFLICPA